MNDFEYGAMPRLRRAIRVLALMLLALVGQGAMAQAWHCASMATTVSGLPTSLAIAPGTAAGTALGSGPFTIKGVLSGCSAPPWGGVGITLGVGTAMTAVSGVSGINFQMVGTPTATPTGGCPTVSIAQNADNVQALALPSSSGFSNCTLTFTASGRFFLGTSRVVGTQSVPATRLNFAYGNYNVSCFTSCGTFTIGSNTTTGNFAIPVYVPACAGVASGTQTVQLPKVSTSTFLNNTSPAGKTRFTISLASCIVKANNGEAGNVGYDAHIRWDFTSGGAANVIANTATSSASSVQVQILKSDATTAVSNTADDVYVLTNGTDVFQYYAAYVNPSGAAVTPGSVTATATLTVTYQ